MARTLLRDSLGIAASQYLSRAVVLVRGLVAAAALGPGGFGAWNALNLILDYGAYASLGALQGLDLTLPALAARDEREPARVAMRGAWWITIAGAIGFAALVAALLGASHWVFASGWGWKAPALMLVAAVLQLAILQHLSVLRAYGDFLPTSVGLSLQALVGGGIGIVTVWRFGVWGLLGGWIVGGVCAIVWMRRSRWRPPLSPAEPGEGLALARRGLPLFAFFALALLIRSLDRIALARFADNHTLGLYGLGLTATALVLYPPEAAAAVLFPRVAAAARGARDPELTRRETVRVQGALMAFLPAAVGVGVLIAPWLLAHVLPAYAPSIAPLRVLALATVVLSMATIPSYYLLAHGPTLSMVAIPAAATLISAGAIFGTVVVAPRPVPVAWAASAGYAAFSFAMLWRAAPRLVPEPRDRTALWISTVAPCAWGALLMWWLSSAADPTSIGATWRCLVFAGLYAPVAIAFGAVGFVRRAFGREA